MNAGPILDASVIRLWFVIASRKLQHERDRLTDLDADGDHATNMERGFVAVLATLDDRDDAAPGTLLQIAGRTLASSVGGASGALWGTALQRAGRMLGEAETFGGQELADALDAALAAIVALGGAREGEKTMVDALAPALRSLREVLEAELGIYAALTAARAAAEKGMRATASLRATKGRASYLGERSIGCEDAGAASTALIIAALGESVGALR